MKTGFLVIISFVFPTFLEAQIPAKADTIIPGRVPAEEQLKEIKEDKIKQHSDPAIGDEPKKSWLIDSTLHNKYGDLLNDDPEYNRQYPVWRAALSVGNTLAVSWFVDRHILHYDFSYVGINSWNNNFKQGWEWDIDRFGGNFVGHPYQGSQFFNAARTHGYDFYESFPFAVAGSLFWEYFAENTRPSYNDIYYTPVAGAFLGEIMYRVTSNILDDRTEGTERFFREAAVAVINLKRAVNRVFQGITFRKTNKEIYQKEPLNITLYAGIHKINEVQKAVYADGPTAAMVNLQLDYGNPFEKRSRKPYDFFKLRIDLRFGAGRKLLSNVIGYGILFGNNKQVGKLAMLVGGFQYFDYWDNKTFELGTVGFGAGAFSKLPLSELSALYTNVHFAIVPLAGTTSTNPPDSSQVRDYHFGGGVQGSAESTLNLGKYVTASVVYNYYLIRTYTGQPGSDFDAILRPRLTLNVYKGLSVGFEHLIYYSTWSPNNSAGITAVRTEQKIFLQIFLEDPQRAGRYN